MSISSLGGIGSVGSVGSVGRGGSVGGVGASVARASSSASEAGSAAKLDISPQAALLSELSALKSSDQTQFKATLTDLASDARAAAKEKGGKEGEFLTTLAGKLDQAASTGDLSVLAPPSTGARPAGGPPGGGPPGGGPPGGGPPPAGGAHGGGRAGEASGSSNKSSATSANSATSEAADANGDGKVSASEQLAYDLAHPDEVAAGATDTSSASDASSASGV